jgi:hypothetical protein
VTLVVDQVVQVLSGMEQTICVGVLVLIRDWIAERLDAHSEILRLNLVPVETFVSHV